jgi:hypothetical protein
VRAEDDLRLQGIITPSLQKVSGIDHDGPQYVWRWVELAIYPDVLDLETTNLILKQESRCSKVAVCGNAFHLTATKRLRLDRRVVQKFK